MAPRLDFAAPAHSGAVIALYPDAPELLAVAGGDPAEDLHLTIAFLGNADDLLAQPGMVEAARQAAEAGAAQVIGPFMAHVSGYGVLGDDEPPATVLFVEADEIEAIHQVVWDALIAAGFAEETHPHFTPHLTLGYGVPVEEAAQFLGTDISFSRIDVSLGGPWPLGPDTISPDQTAPAAEASPTATAAMAVTDVQPSAALVAAGLAVKAADTGRVLMIQRYAGDETDPAAGTWEFPGGHIDPGETPEAAARREWAEEVGQPVPDGTITGSWQSPDGIYQGFVLTAVDETAVHINPDPENRGALNPDDPDGDLVEVACWWDTEHLVDNPALRQELKDDPGWMPALEANVMEATGGAPAPLPIVKTARRKYRLKEKAMTDIAPAPVPDDEAGETPNDIGVGDLVELDDDTSGIVTEILTEGDLVPIDNVPVQPTPETPILTIQLDPNADGSPGAVVYEWATDVEMLADADEIADTDDAPVAGLSMSMTTHDTLRFSVQPDGTWEGPLIPEGMASGDGRQIQPEALVWRDLPLPLMAMFKNEGEGHNGAQLAGSITWLERREGPTPGTYAIWGGGKIDLGGSAGQELFRLMTEGMMRGVSADLDDVTVEYENAPPSMDAPLEEPMGFDPGLMLVTSGRVMGATACSFPAFQEAYIYLLDGDPAGALEAEPVVAEAEAIVASAWNDAVAIVAAAGLPSAQARSWWPLAGPSALVAAGAPVAPPAAWFDTIDYDTEPYPVRVEADGRIHGFVARFDECHISFQNKCTPAPRSPSKYARLCNKATLTAEGTMAATAPLFMDTVHPNLRALASDAQAHYHDTGAAVADFSAYDLAKGIFIAGAVRPDATPGQVRALRGSDHSPDWRPFRGQLDCVAMLAVNCSGFNTPASLVASAGLSDGERPTMPGVPRMTVDLATGEVTAMVAAGMVRHETDRLELADQIAGLHQRLRALERWAGPLRHQAAMERLAVVAGG